MKFKVEFMPELKREPEIIEADDVTSTSVYTAQFLDSDGRTLCIVGGVHRVTRMAENRVCIEPLPVPPPFSTVNTEGKAVEWPKSSESWPCQAQETTEKPAA